MNWSLTMHTSLGFSTRVSSAPFLASAPSFARAGAAGVKEVDADAEREARLGAAGASERLESGWHARTRRGTVRRILCMGTSAQLWGLPVGRGRWGRLS